MSGKNIAISLESIVDNPQTDLKSIHSYFSKILEHTIFPSYVIPDVNSRYLVGLDMLKKKMYRESLFSSIKVQEEELYNIRSLQTDELVEIITRELQNKDVFYAYEPNINMSLSIEGNHFYLVWNNNKSNVKLSDFNVIRLGLSREKLFEVKYFENYRREIPDAPIFGIYIKAPIFKLRSIIKLFYFHIIEFNYILTSKSLPNSLYSDNRVSDLYYNPINFNEINNYPPRILVKKTISSAVLDCMYVIEQNISDLTSANIILVSDTKYNRPFEGVFSSSLDFNHGNYVNISFNPENYEWGLKIVLPSDSRELFQPISNFEKMLKKWLS